MRKKLPELPELAKEALGRLASRKGEPVSERDVWDMAELNSFGLTYTELGEARGIPYYIVSDCVQGRRQPGYREYGNYSVDQMVELRNSGLLLREIAAAVGVSHETVRKVLNGR